LLAIPEGVHSLPEAPMEEGLDFSARDQGVDGFLLEHLVIVGNVGKDVGLKHEEAAIDPATFIMRLFAKGEDLGVLETECAEASHGLDAGHGDALTMSFVEGDRGGDVDVGNTIAIGHTERLVAFHKLRDLSETPTRSGLLASVDESHPPWFGHGVVDRHRVLGHVEGDVGGVKKIIGEVLLDDVALVAAADDEIVDAVRGVELENVPENRQAADLNHRLWAKRGFFADSGTETACENNCFHPLGSLKQY